MFGFSTTPVTTGGALDEFISGGCEQTSFTVGGFEVVIQPIWVVIVLVIAAIVYLHYAEIKVLVSKAVCKVKGLLKSSKSASKPADAPKDKPAEKPADAGTA